MINNVTLLWVGQFDVYYNYSTINVTDVTNGDIGGTTVPMPGNWGLVCDGPDNQGIVRVIIDLTATAGVTGSGCICDIHLNVIGSTGDTSPLDFVEGMGTPPGFLELSDYDEQPIDATWVNSSVSVK